ncbi:MAG: outer membrane protein assembly factor BamE [Exilibacterium sp.]
MQKATRYYLASLILTTLAGCSYFQFPGVYKIDVQQGNIVTQEMVNKLKPGMTKRQVRFIMGTPLVVDTFNQNRWDYYYSLLNANGDITKERVSIFFDDDKLTHLTGAYRPNEEKDAESKLTAQE